MSAQCTPPCSERQNHSGSFRSNGWIRSEIMVSCRRPSAGPECRARRHGAARGPVIHAPSRVGNFGAHASWHGAPTREADGHAEKPFVDGISSTPVRSRMGSTPAFIRISLDLGRWCFFAPKPSLSLLPPGRYSDAARNSPSRMRLQRKRIMGAINPGQTTYEGLRPGAMKCGRTYSATACSDCLVWTPARPRYTFAVS